MTPTPTDIGIAHLTLLGLTPPDVVTTAAEAGFDFVGLRVQAATAGEQQYPMQPGSPMARETLRRLDDTGLTVRDVEFLSIGPGTGPEYWGPALEAGAALGARTISVVGVDPESSRLIDSLAALTVDARAVGIIPTLEPISYQPWSTVAQTAPIARAAGAALLLDATHVQRAGSTLDDVRSLEPELVPCVQICDGPLELPPSLDVPGQLPLGMTTNGSSLQDEARALRDVPGEGEFDLSSLLSSVPSGTPVSVEAPNAILQQRMSAVDFAKRNARAARSLLDAVQGATHV